METGPTPGFLLDAIRCSCCLGYAYSTVDRKLSSNMAIKGRITEWYADKGYGYVTSEADALRIKFYQRDVSNSVDLSGHAGQAVRFRLVQDDAGIAARRMWMVCVLFLGRRCWRCGFWPRWLAVWCIGVTPLKWRIPMVR